jgi:quercetin dioxygenase-like cupin family protein
MSHNFNYIGNVDISIIKNKLHELGENIWSEHTLRQTIYDAHKHTETVELMWDLNSLTTNKKGNIHSNFYLFNIGEFLNEIKPSYVEKYGEGDFIRVLLVKLKKRCSITPHVDSGDSLSSCKRTHIAIITNPNVIFTVGDETKNMMEGDIWEINNQNTHSVDNNSDEDRIHFIIDYETFNNKYKLKKSLL